MTFIYPAVFSPKKDGKGYHVEFPDLACCEADGPDLEDALDACVDSLIRQIRKNKTKLERRLREVSFDEVFNAPEAEEEEFDIVRTKAVELRPQSAEEAILQMNMLGHTFYMFLNADSGAVNVVYRRKDGGYSILEPQAEEA